MEKIEKISVSGTKIIDITRELSAKTEVWPGDRPFQLHKQATHEQGDGYELSWLEMSLHAGTHVDFPRHILKSGRQSTDYGVERFLLPVRVHDPACVSEIDCRHIPVRTGEIRALLLKGRDTWLSDCAARLVAEYGYSLFGTEAMSVDKRDSDHFPAHRTLLSNDIPIVENLDLSGVEPGEYLLIVMPLKIVEAEAAPARCILIQQPV